MFVRLRSFLLLGYLGLRGGLGVGLLVFDYGDEHGCGLSYMLLDLLSLRLLLLGWLENRNTVDILVEFEPVRVTRRTTANLPQMAGLATTFFDLLLNNRLVCLASSQLVGLPQSVVVLFIT